MKHLKCIVILSFFLLFGACDKGEMITVDEPNNNKNRTLNISVLYCDVANDPYCEATQGIQEARIYLFKDAYDRENGEPIIEQRKTDINGSIQFTQLEEEYYYLRTVSAHGQQDTYETTPNNTVVKHEVIFY